MRGRIVAIDFGTRRTGIAVSDPLQLIASGLETVDTHKLRDFLKTYFQKEAVSELVIGLPLNREKAEIEVHIEKFIQELNQDHPQLPISRFDERFTSLMASREIAFSGLPKKKRMDKKLIDRVSAVLILQDYLKYRKDSL